MFNGSNNNTFGTAEIMTTMPGNPNYTGSSFTKNGLPRLINILLIIPLAFGFSILSEQFFTPSGHSIPVAANQQFTAIPAVQNINLINSQQIAHWHLFGKESVKKAPAKPEKTAAPVTRLKLTLRGIAAENDRHQGLAIIQKPNKEEKHFKVGDNVFGLATLDEIYTDHVMLLRNGHYEKLFLPKLKDSSGKKKIAAAAGKSRATSTSMIKPTSPIHVDNKFWEYLDYEPAVINGRIAGLKLVAEEKDEEEILLSNGLKPGDVVIDVNGHSMKSGQGVSNAINALADDDRLVFTLKRDGKTKKVTVQK